MRHKLLSIVTPIKYKFEILIKVTITNNWQYVLLSLLDQRSMHTSKIILYLLVNITKDWSNPHGKYLTLNSSNSILINIKINCCLIELNLLYNKYNNKKLFMKPKDLEIIHLSFGLNSIPICKLIHLNRSVQTWQNLY